MSVHDEIKRLANLVAKDVRAGRASDASRQAHLYLDQNLDAALAVIDLVQREANRKKPNEYRVQAYVLLFGQALELIRYRVEGGYDWAEELVDGIRETILLLARGGKISGSLLVPLLNGFREAGLEAGEELTALAGELFAEEAEAMPDQPVDLGELDEALEALAEDLGGDVFGIHGQIAEMGQSLPPEFRMFLLERTASSPCEALRDTAPLSLLDPSPEVRGYACRVVERIAAPSQVSPAALRRMIVVRNWLPQDERPVLDAAISQVRRKGVACASWPSRELAEVLATTVDGAGAQSVFAILKEGRKHVLAGLLVKQGVGIADAWCLRDQSKADVARILDELRSAVIALPVAFDFVEMLVRHHLAVGLNKNGLPPAGLLDFVETVGMAHCEPAELGAERLIEALEGDVDPTRLQPEAVDRVLEVTAAWPENMPFAETWFENDAEVDDFIQSRATGTTAAGVDLVVDGILESRRAKWEERFLWMALWAKHETERRGPWHEFLVLAREIHRGRPLKEIPIMQGIAAETLAAQASLH